MTFEGHNIHTEYASLRSRIGMVPQDDVVHRQLTVNQALGYAAELRLPPDTSKTDREEVVAQVLEELELTKHADTRVDKLSGGQRKRASVALELLTGPSLLILDEPTTGLDPALDRQVMMMLRQLADAGRVVLVVTHSVSYLDVCDQLLLVAPGGKTAFLGPPSQIGAAMGTTNWADIFTKVGADPDEANRRFLAENNHQPLAVPSQDSPAADLGEPVHTDVFRQFSTIARRQIRLVVSDRGYTVFLALLPFLIGVLTLTVRGKKRIRHVGPAGQQSRSARSDPGHAQCRRGVHGYRADHPRPDRRASHLPPRTGGRPIDGGLHGRQDRGVLRVRDRSGSDRDDHLDSRLGHADLQRRAPGQWSNLELFVTVAATCVGAALLGMALSALAQSQDQIMPMLVVSIMSQLVFSGGMIWVTDRIVLDQLSWATPARWGFAASASTIDAHRLIPGPTDPKDQHWDHTKAAWLFDMAMLGVLCVVYSAVVWWRIRLKRR